MATAKKTQIVITANAAVAKKVMDELQQRIDCIKQKMAGLDVTTEQGQREFKKLEKELVSYNSAVAQNITNTERIGKAMKNLSGTSINELKRALSAAKSELGKMSANDKGLKQMQGNVKALQKQIDELTGSVHKQSSAWKTALRNLTAYVGLFAVFNKIKDVVTAAIKKNFDYSGSLTDIRKVSGLAMEDVNKLSTELANIDTRTSVDGLAQLAYQGAKLGMGKYGVDGMKQFVAAADQINVAIGEEMGENALPALSKMVESMGLIPKMGIEKAMLATGSAMFKLSSTSTATSTNIVEFAKRLTGVSRTAGITTDQLLALGSASDSLFLMPEVSATAMSKFIVALQKNHNLIEKDLGIQQGTIANMYAAGNAMDAIVLVLEKMRDKGNMNTLGSIFKDLGSDGQRLVTAMVTMSKNVDVLKDHLYESQEAFEEATAVTSEYEMQQQSAIGILERANNLWEKAFVNPEGVDMVKNMAQAWYDMSELMTQSPIFKGTLSAALSLVITTVKILVVLLPSLINYLVALGVWKTVTFLVTMTKSLWAAITAQNALNAACKVNPYVALASVIMTAIGVIAGFVNQANEAAKAEKEAAEKANEWKNHLGKAADETSDLVSKLHSYKSILEQTNLSQAQRNSTIGRFNRDFRQYISNLGIEIKNVNDLRKHYNDLAREVERSIYYREKQKALEEGTKDEVNGRVGAANVLSNYMRSHNTYGAIKPSDVLRMLSNGISVNQVYLMLQREYVKIMAQKKLYKYEKVKPENFKNVSNNGDILFSFKDQYGNINKYNAGDKELLSILRYNKNSITRERNKRERIARPFDDIIGDPNYTPYQEETPGTLENKAPDKNAIRIEKQKKREREKAWRDELKQKQDEANAVLDNVRNFYERQINEKLSQVVSLGMDKTEQDLFVEPVKHRMNEALKQFRLAIAGKKNSLGEFKKTMANDLIEKADETGTNLSKDLLDNIMSNNVDALHNFIMKLSKNLGLPDNAAIAQIFAKATKNEQANSKLEAQQSEARRKVAQENDYMAAVKQNMYDDFNTMGYANPTDTEIADKKAFDMRKNNIIKMYEKARKEISTLYTIDVSSEKDRGVLIQFLFGDDPDKMGERITSVLGNNAENWEVFYNKLIQYSDNYTEAQKKTYDQQKKIADQVWAVNKRNLAQQERIRKIQNESNLFGKHTNFLSNLGLIDLTADPEVELMKARMQAAEDYYAFVQANYRNQQLIDEAERTRQEAELNYANQMATAMKSRLSQMKELVQPIEDFGAAVGQALADMRNDADSANAAIKSAVKSMLESWGKMALNDVNTQMWKAINDAGAKRSKEKTKVNIQSARDNADIKASTVKTDLSSDLGTKRNPIHAIIEAMPMGDAMKSEEDLPEAFDPYTHDYLQDENTPASNSSQQNTNSNNNSHSESIIHSSNVINTAAQTGDAIADVATGNSSLAEAGADIAMSGINAAFNVDLGSGKKKEDKEKKKQIKEEKRHQKELTKETEKGLKEREKKTDKGVKTITQTTEEGNKEQSKGTEIAQQTIVNATDAALNTTLTAKQKNNDATLQSDAQRTQGEVTFSIAGAMAKCFEFLGPIAGPIAAAVVMSTLMGLLQWALSSAMGGSSKKSSSSSTKNNKIVSGMLTYDSGNVQDLKPYVADNGEVYWAQEERNIPKSGVNLLRTPTATTINGQSSLVAERGPELVIGRETTQAMMMNNPSLLKALVNYDANYSGRNAKHRTFDEGNVSETIGNFSSEPSLSDGLIADCTASNAALLQTVNALLQRLNEPILAKIDMYGRGNLYDSMTKANQFMKGK